MAFGRYSSKEATNYVEDGFKRLSADNTKAYDALVADGVDRKAAFDAIKGLSAITSDKDAKEEDETTAAQKKREYIMSLEGMSAKQKRVLDRMVVSNGEGYRAAFYDTPENFKISSYMSGQGEKARVQGWRALQAGVSADNYIRYEDIYRESNKKYGVSDTESQKAVS